MDPISEKVNQWIKDGRDPRSAHWQGGLEAMLELFSPHVQPGVLSLAAPLEETDIPAYKSALEALDLSPNLIAVFLPPSIAGSLTPPETARELHRVAPGTPSYKIIIARPGKELRLICAEISDTATKPGAEIFQSGALLGTYDFESKDVCLAELTKIIRTHAWEKETWSREDIERYTFNWFERVLDIGRGDIEVDSTRSFFHSPTLIKSNRIDALFYLIITTLKKQISDPKNSLSIEASSIRTVTDPTIRSKNLNDIAGQAVLELLNHIKELEIIKFDELSNAENEKFINETSRSVRILVDTLS